MKIGWKKILAATAILTTIIGTIMEPVSGRNVVHAAEVAQKVLNTYVELGETKTFNQYDVTGDGKTDTLKVTVGEKAVTIYVNGKKAYTQKGETDEDASIILYTLKGQTPMLVINSDWYSDLYSKVLQYKSGKFVQIINLHDKKGFVFGNTLQITKNKIKAPFTEQYCIGNAEFIYTYTKKGGKWHCSKYGTYVQDSYNTSGIKAIKDFPAYTGVNLKKKAFTVKTGTYVKVKKCRVYKGDFYIQLEYKGKKGWIKDAGPMAGIMDIILAG